MQQQHAIDVRAYCERWVRWAFGARSYERSLTGKLMDGMGTKTCPTCRGRGQAPGKLVGSELQWVTCPQCDGERRIKGGDLDPVCRSRAFRCNYCKDDKGISRGEINGTTCIKCRGSGWRTDIQLKVNPAGIRGTRAHGQNEDDDPISMLIDTTVAGWEMSDATYWWHAVILMEYTENGTQAAKARVHGISQSWYSKNLSRAHEELAGIIEPMVS